MATEGRKAWGETSDDDSDQEMDYQEERYNKRKKKSSMGDGSDCEQTINKVKQTRSEADKEEEREIKVLITFAKQSEQQTHPVKLSKAIEK